jgi:hypothetical protein
MSPSASANIFSNKSPVQDWRIVRREIVSRKADAFGHTGYSFSYSGPDLIVSPRNDIYVPFSPRISNLVRTKNAVADLARLGVSATWLDGSEIGEFLFIKNDLYEGLKEFYTALTGVDWDAQREGADFVMSRVSRAYIKSAFGYGATAVCGADHKRIFCRYEMSTLVNNGNILAINDLPRGLVQDFYAINKDEAFQVICLAELLLSKSRMEANDNEDTWRDFFQRQYFLNGERNLISSRVAPLSKKWEYKREEKREEIFANYAGLICNDMLKNMLSDIRPLCPTVVSLPVHAGKSRAHRAGLA